MMIIDWKKMKLSGNCTSSDLTTWGKTFKNNYGYLIQLHHTNTFNYYMLSYNSSHNKFVIHCWPTIMWVTTLIRVYSHKTIASIVLYNRSECSSEHKFSDVSSWAMTSHFCHCQAQHYKFLGCTFDAQWTVSCSHYFVHLYTYI